MSATIRHDPIGRTLIAYLAAQDTPVSVARIVAYCALMHRSPRMATHMALGRAVKAGAAQRVKRGWYQGRYQVAA